IAPDSIMSNISSRLAWTFSSVSNHPAWQRVHARSMMGATSSYVSLEPASIAPPSGVGWTSAPSLDETPELVRDEHAATAQAAAMNNHNARGEAEALSMREYGLG